MDKKTVIDIIRHFQRILANKGISTEKVILYGSYAEGTFREGSDIDLIVISRDFIDRNYWERIDILTDAIYEIFEPIEAIGLTPEEWVNGHSIATEFARNGEVLQGIAAS
jgi:predicted nucleotidyltransferase